MPIRFRTTGTRSVFTHVAFEAVSREAVDGCWEWVLTQEVMTESAPKEFPHYAPGYYAAFFYDPDGIKLEVVYEPTRAATTSSSPAEACDYELAATG